MDALNKRINFLNDVIKSINLENINTIHARAEELGKNENYRESYDVVVSRAVAKLNVLIEYMLPFVKVGGMCICMKGSNVEEIEEANNAIEILGGKIEKIEKLQFPDSDIVRNNILIRKVKTTPNKYPRKAGTPQKEPII